MMENDRHIRVYEKIEGGSIDVRLDFGPLIDHIWGRRTRQQPVTAHYPTHDGSRRSRPPSAEALDQERHRLRTAHIRKRPLNPSQALTSLRAFVAFCLTASAVYILNDIADVESDRAHPEKKNRPLASGAITRRSALGILALLLCAVFFLCAAMQMKFIVVIAAYFLLNVAYSFRLKEVVLLDVFLIAAGFMLRVLGGAYAISVQVSELDRLCSMFISLFLGSPRGGGTRERGGSGIGSPRRVLLLYRVEFLDQMLTISAAGAVIAYALYTVAPGPWRRSEPRTSSTRRCSSSTVCSGIST